MPRVIVHVKHQRSPVGMDVEVPAEVPLERLAYLLADALKWIDRAPDQTVHYVVRETASGKPLPLQASLADLGLWDGTYLLFEPVIRRNPSTQARVQPASLDSESGRRYTLMHSVHRLGRSSSSGSNDANLIDLKQEPQGQTVSRHHADLRCEQDGWFLRSLPDAQNQTLHNDELLEPGRSYPVKDGDWMQFGAVRLRFQVAKKADRVIP